MLFEIAIENFKPFGTKQRARLAPLTLIYGPNSGGKSSIVQSLMLLRQSVGDSFDPAHPIVAKGNWIDVGSFISLLHRHDLSRLLQFELSFKPLFFTGALAQESVENPFDPAHLRTVGLTFHAETEKSGRPHLAQITYKAPFKPANAPIEDLCVGLKRISPPEYLSDLLPPEQIADTTYEWTDPGAIRSYAQFLLMRGEVTSNRAITWERQQLLDLVERLSNRTPTRRGLFLGELESFLADCVVIGRANFPELIIPKKPLASAAVRKEFGASPVFGAPGLGVISDEYQRVLRRIEYLGPLRRYPERYYLVKGSAENVGREGENTPQLMLSDYAVEALNRWFEIFNISYKVEIRRQGDEVVGEIMAIRLEDQRTNTRVAPTDVGFGLGQILPVLVQGIILRGRTICVEQPEIHLHPRLQGTLGDFFLWSSGVVTNDGMPKRDQGTGQYNQWIVETHSEALILRVQRRIREGLVKNSDVSVVYVRPEAEIGSEIIRLEIDEKGHFIQTWPDGFFEEAFEEVFS